MIYRHRKFDLPISDIRIHDIGKSTDFFISENQVELTLSVNRFFNIGEYDFPISANQNYFRISVIRISDIGKSAD